jgi:hypothetical protein
MHYRSCPRHMLASRPSHLGSDLKQTAHLPGPTEHTEKHHSMQTLHQNGVRGYSSSSCKALCKPLSMG